MKVKIMSYNVYGGFYNYERSKDNYYHNVEREKLAKQLVKEQNPDILLILEANFMTDNKYNFKQDYQKIFGYEYYYHGSDNTDNESDGIAVLSKYKIISSKNHCIKDYLWIRTKIEISKKILMIDTIHPFPKRTDETSRYGWIKKIIKDKKEPYIIAGDFNSLSHKDDYDKEELLKWFKIKIPDNYKEKVENMLTSKTTKLLEKEGLIDSLKIFNKEFIPTHPTSIRIDPALRLDYIFCSKDIKIISSKVIKNKMSEKASDHYPIITEIEI